MTNVFHEHFESTVKFAPTLRANDYSAENRYQAELNSIFHREWIYAAHQSQFPEKGSYLTFDIADKPLLLVRGQDDEIRAFYNICVHRGHILAEGSGKASHFTCPYHAWTYALDGRLRAARGVSDIDQLPKCHRSLVPVETHTKDGFVFVRLSPGDNSFTERYGSFFTELQEQLPELGRLRFAKRFTAEVNGNWKIMIENYLECYHCSPTHPALADLMRIREYRVRQSDFFLSTQAPAGRPDNIAYQYELREDSQKNFSGWWLWPNVTFNISRDSRTFWFFTCCPSLQRSRSGTATISL
ncbi:aromatic ring-hydroxylating oxygenase subunit alpha [Rhizobium rhizoryzae]|uniref:Phenylpropionate dioxygenase-like ring-hydroxylating dioxygenase large terminal subunit n=1 Tax=Rhizobium rhizoryzae TaxID=451876 RepID=A0A7W6LIB0_9HYPH|nr:aromatic ring-hydroxylating dioxygenase subunit alpha [Rhizobium rhizoryzae]MBB4144771.1 phenylpropionate dioxygenase-like ring-hydroxylating dioxygenase large terminal subunit [Rhizobium rhizoryzae]